MKNQPTLTSLGLLALALALSTAGCKKDKVEDPTNPGSNTNTNPPVTHNVTFLKEGLTLRYYYDDGWSSDSIITVVEKKLSQEIFMVRNYSSISYLYPTQYWKLSNGNFMSSFRLRDNASYVTECKFSQSVGTSWPVQKGTYSYTYSIEAVDVIVVTNTDTIKDAVKVKVLRNSDGAFAYSYFSPSIGPLGTGNDTTGSAVMELDTYTLGQEVGAGASLPPISYGTFNFLKVGNIWRYEEYDYSIGQSDTLELQIVSQTANVYKIRQTFKVAGVTYYTYWFEDMDMLMVYEDGETIDKADPIYMRETSAQVNYGWSGLTLSGTTFIYRIEDFNVSQYSTFGTFNCMTITVSSGLFSSQTNYWNQDKGQIFVSASSVDLDLLYTNAKRDAVKPILAVFTY